MDRLRIFVFAFFILSCLLSCKNLGERQADTTTETVENPLAKLFPRIALRDTLFLGSEVNKGNDSLLAMEDAIAWIGEDLLTEHNSYFDRESTKLHAFYRFDLAPDMEAYFLGQSDSWVLHNSLLIFNKSQQKFVDNIPVAGIDGGDGGQQLIDSWLLDWDGDGKKDLLTRVHDQWIRMDPEKEEAEQHAKDSCYIRMHVAGGSPARGLDQLPAFLDRYPVNW